jgi:hypothetical protein
MFGRYEGRIHASEAQRGQAPYGCATPFAMLRPLPPPGTFGGDATRGVLRDAKTSAEQGNWQLARRRDFY